MYHDSLPAMEDFQKWHYPKLKEENESLRFQLEAYKNEVDLLKAETSSSGEEKDKQLKLLQQTLQGMQQVRGGGSWRMEREK